MKYNIKIPTSQKIPNIIIHSKSKNKTKTKHREVNKYLDTTVEVNEQKIIFYKLSRWSTGKYYQQLTWYKIISR